MAMNSSVTHLLELRGEDSRTMDSLSNTARGMPTALQTDSFLSLLCWLKLQEGS